jgi:hypothetical protein
LAYSFGAVIATNVIHATAHLTVTMSTVNFILSACAHLVFNELSQDTVLEGITFGLTDGWWMFVDIEIRSSFPLMRPLAWQMLFTPLGLGMLAYSPEVGAFN